MAILANVQGLFKQRYGRWIEPLPDKHTLADFGDFIPGENRPGLGYNFPVLTGIEHGQTANVDGTAFTLNPAIDSQVLNASLDGATIMVRSAIPYDVIYKSLNGTGSGSTGGAFKTALDQAVQAMLLGGSLYRELALAFGPGTSTAAASNIGVVGASISGTNIGAGGPQVVTLTTASWIPGLWILAQNMLVDIYQTDGSTLRASAVRIVNRPTTNLTRLTLASTPASTNPNAVVAGNDVLVPYGWKSKSCFGLEAIYNNATTLFNIDAGSVAPWRCLTFNAAGDLSRAKIMAYAAQAAMNGLSNGGKLFVASVTFAILSEEFNAITNSTTGVASVSTYDGNQASKQIGSSNIKYVTAAGVIEVEVYQYQKQGQAFFIANDNFRRVGSTDLTMKPIGHGQEGFFTQLQDKAGAEMRIYSNQAPVFEMPYRNFLITGITNTNYAILQG